MNTQLEICIDNYIFYVTVTTYYSCGGDPRADNPDDYFGYVDLEYDLDAVYVDVGECQEELVELSKEDADSLQEQFESLLEEKIIEALDDIRESNYIDYQEHKASLDEY